MLSLLLEQSLMSLAARLSEQVQRTPDAIVVSDIRNTYRFSDFYERITRIAGGMREVYALDAGTRVLLFMENRGEFLELLFACWHLGCAVVPVNSRLHPEEVVHIAADAQVALAFVSGACGDVIHRLHASGNVPVVDIDSTVYQSLPACQPVAMAAAAPDTLAWLFYTSGTTGKPKGAMLSHRNLVFMCEAYCSDLGYPCAGDTQLHAAPLSHGAGMYALPHLLAGGRQQILAQFDPQAVIEAIAVYQGVSFFAAPTMVMRLVNYPDAHPSLFAHLKFIVYGGAPMYVADLKKALSLFGPRLYQLYGQGEAPMTITGLSQANHMAADFQAREARLASCGYPRNGVEVAVFDAEGNALPSGVVGEIVTRSPCVMQGYWNNPEATRDTLQDGWLYTGDIGSMRDDGLLTLQDRSKDLIISGGSDVYPREIEEVLLRHPGVRECALVGKPDSEWGGLPAAFIVPATKPAPTIAELESLVLDHLARFKRPRVWIFVDSLPKNNYGKVLKTALRRELAKWDS